MKKFAVLLALVAVLIPLTASAEKPPHGFDAVLLYIGDGLYDWTRPHPIVPGCGDPVPTLCDGNYFHERFMNRTPAETAAEGEEAKAFFAERFGIDIDEIVLEGRGTFEVFLADPRINYRVHHITDQHVPPAGYRIFDGGWRFVALDPNGIELGGPFTGTTMNAGSYVVYGDYYIQAPEPFSIHFRSASPIVPSPEGSASVRCEVYHAEYGWGLAQAMSEFAFAPDGRVKLNVRNMITFPALGRRGGWVD